MRTGSVEIRLPTEITKSIQNSMRSWLMSVSGPDRLTANHVGVVMRDNASVLSALSFGRSRGTGNRLRRSTRRFLLFMRNREPSPTPRLRGMEGFSRTLRGFTAERFQHHLPAEAIDLLFHPRADGLSLARHQSVEFAAQFPVPTLRRSLDLRSPHFFNNVRANFNCSFCGGFNACLGNRR